MLGKLPFRSKLVLVVSVPLLVLILFAGVAIKDRFDALVAQEQYGERGRKNSQGNQRPALESGRLLGAGGHEGAEYAPARVDAARSIR